MEIFRLLLSGALCSCLLGILLSDDAAPERTMVANLTSRPFQGGNPDVGRTKIAEGEYAVIEEANSGAFGPFGEETYNFHETWTLSKDTNGQYEVEGERRFESPQDWPHTDRFNLLLSRDLTLIRMTELAKLRWRPDSGPLSCEFLTEELHCSSGGSNPKQEIQLHTPVQEPYGLLWPVSPFSLTSLTRQAERDPTLETPVQLVTIEQPDVANPVSVLAFGGYLRYLGDEPIRVADRQWLAHKFSLKVAMHPKFLIWTSLRGLLVAAAIEHSHPNWPQEGIRLVRFQKRVDF